jgi:ribonuclease BN (tRNA processing enzyme)
VQVRFLGAHQCESAGKHFASLLVDDRLAIDAGALTSTLSLDQQLAIEGLLLTHRHWDHIKDVPGFGFNLYSYAMAGFVPRPVDVFASADVFQALTELLLSSRYWLEFFSRPAPSDPILRFREIVDDAPVCFAGYEILPIAANHGIPTNGYQVTDADGRKLYYTSDNGPGSGVQWALASPHVLVTECTFSNAQSDLDGGRMHGHLCPSELQKALEEFRDARGYLPRVAVIHVNPYYEVAIRAELASVARALDAVITVATEGDVLEV